ncbi:S26 family signal peptidase [Actinomadura sp. NEAU-AAG7]|uniref:S26 family signal peptidase n=1 Tax=Actinomadura sp. NEAU-AAG7 TaxID=2839640 RepID=UPI001BE46087|nr:S26 family signal peptidase [Actinomadura sp. NEAU-AAG7]MBT2209897.1 hypothetical protein [Actinomadura sp. NEAU-AAG7]
MTGRRTGAAAAAVVGAAALLAVSARRRFVVVTVQGASMEPTYRSDDRVLVRRGRAPARGEIVVVEQPVVGLGWPAPPVPRGGAPGRLARRDWYIKRVAGAPGDALPAEAGLTAPAPNGRVPDGGYVLLGDNPRNSVDSRQMGLFPRERILGTVVRVLDR